MRKFFLLCFFVGASFSTTNGQTELYYSKGCASCHGQNAEGNILTKAPALAGLQNWYVQRQLHNFKNGVRGRAPQDIQGKVMVSLASVLLEEEIEEIANFIGKLSPMQSKPSIGGFPAEGKKYYEVCSACHGVDGKGNQQLNAPAIVYLQDWYLQSQIRAFKNQYRGNINTGDTIGTVMEAMIATLPDDTAIRDVISYVNYLQN